MTKHFSLESVESSKEKIKTAPRGFKYGFVPQVFKEEVYKELINNFPLVENFKLVDKQSGGGRKRFYTGPVYDANKHKGCICHLSHLPEIWSDVLKECASKEFIDYLSQATGVRFNTMCTFGFAYGNEGCIQEPHLDGAVRKDDPNEIHSTIACLLYFNREHGGTGGTRVYDTDRKSILFQAPDLRNGLFFFEQHPDAWHGFPLVGPGKDRRLVSLAYSNEMQPLNLKTNSLHPLFCKNFFKHKIKKILGKVS